MSHREYSFACIGLGAGVLLGVLSDFRKRKTLDPIGSIAGLVLLAVGLTTLTV